MVMLTSVDFATKALDGRVEFSQKDGLVVKSRRFNKSSITSDMLHYHVDDLIAMQEKAFTFLKERNALTGVWLRNCNKILQDGKRIVSAISNRQEREIVAENLLKFSEAY